jgi:hypothetical protein
MRFLFISNSKHLLYPTRDASTRYRCLHPIEALSELGYHADLCTQREFGWNLTDLYDAYIFHRPRYSRYFAFLINRLNRLGKVVIADYDDLLFSPEHAGDAPIYRNGQASLRITRKLHQNYLAALQLFDNFTTSTSPLAEQIRLKKPSATIEVIHNGYSANWVTQARINPPKDDRIVAGYFPGTRSHDRDFNHIAGAVTSWLEKSRHMLTIVGPLEISAPGFPVHTIQHRDHVPYRLLPQLVSTCHLTLAPLEKTLFNHCKSGIKFFESALFGVPIITSPIPDMVRFKESGLILANSPEDFYDGLHYLSEDSNNHSERCADAHRYALRNCSALTQTERMLRYVQSLIPCTISSNSPPKKPTSATGYLSH